MGSRSSSASGFDYADDRPPSARLTNADDECALAECPEDDLSEEYLQQHCSTKHLGSVTELEIQVDSTVQSIECLGHHLPGLRQLRLSNSSILGIRELGSSLTNLDVLWMSRCGLQDLDGVQVLDSLQELYLPFNDIADVSQLKWLDKLCVLDLEGNALANSKDVEELSRCYQLQDVTIRGNPVWHNEGLCRAAVLEMLPQISVLDDHPRFSNGPPEMAVQESSSHPHRYIDLYLETDLDMYLDFYLESTGSEDETEAAQEAHGTEDECRCPVQQQSLLAKEFRERVRKCKEQGPFLEEPDEHQLLLEQVKRPQPRMRMGARRPAPQDAIGFGFRLPDRRRLPARAPGVGQSEEAQGACEAASDLTMGDSVAGNPLAALRHRRSQASAAAGLPGVGEGGIRDLLRRYQAR